ncbi:hypothetical protein [Amycolatopsis sp. EV170708-02-1]|uniref:hypothetical protein n=1 Tax=Amycolatopsis sp. EV170708-02-1 TaxID=2919322 RepID=UPI001F0C75F2|nr:hypothetical protein [Amycolatopsis sp. EV170708-02-1]UMP00027.1 hypothetical protein MJQ72_26355 [Amycolatopsis sp. EV170708-02-1]
MRKQREIRRSLAATGAVLVGVAGALLGSGPAAQAASGAGVEVMGWPSECNYGVLNRYMARAVCQNPNGGKYQGIVICEGGQVGRVHRFGPWVSSGFSDAYCQGTENAVTDGAGINSSPDPL